MIWLVTGVLLWMAAHLFKRVLPEQRAALGRMGRPLVALAILVSIGLMVIGYRASEPAYLYALPAWVWYLNNALMFVAVFLMDVGRVNGMVRTRIRRRASAGQRRPPLAVTVRRPRGVGARGNGGDQPRRGSVAASGQGLAVRRRESRNSGRRDLCRDRGYTLLVGLSRDRILVSAQCKTNEKASFLLMARSTHLAWRQSGSAFGL
jgi:hypothetical protein